MRIRLSLTATLALTLLPSAAALAASPSMNTLFAKAPAVAPASTEINYRGVLHALACAASAQLDSVVNGIRGGSIIDRNRDNVCFNLGRAHNGVEHLAVWVMVNEKSLPNPRLAEMSYELYERISLVQSFCHAFEVDSRFGKPVRRGDQRELEARLKQLHGMVDALIAGTQPEARLPR